MSDIIHLQTHSAYSLRRSTLRLSDLIATASARGHRAIALTDTDALYAMVPFVQSAEAAGIKPIVGAELTLGLAGVSPRGPYRVTLLVRNEAGYRNLCRLLSRFHLLNGREGVDPAELPAHAEGLLLMTGGEWGAIPRLLAQGKEREVTTFLGTWQEAFGRDHCYVQLGPWWRSLHLDRLATRHDLPVVAAHEARHLMPEDAVAWRRLQLAHGHGHPAPGPRHLATDDELEAMWREVPAAIAHMARINDACHFRPVFGVPRLPRFTPPDDRTSDSYLQALCSAGLERLYAGSERYPEAAARMEYELSVIRQMGFVDYFLIAWDLARFARSQGIPILPRGSAAGSLTLYLLGVSVICPLEHQLCFERFLNPERKGLPDIDIDFDWRRRDEVVDYCYRTYGDDHVARIATHQHHGARGAIRVAGAGLGLEASVIDAVAERMPRWSGGGDLATAIQSSPECQGLDVGREPYKTLLVTAKAYEDTPDHLGLHPCGLVISREPLTDVVPLEVSTKGPVVTQFEMNAVEAVGLLKMDLLGNRNLAILHDAVALVNERHGLDLVAEDLPLDDPEAFALLRSGRTYGIYQLESGGVQGLLRQFKPKHVADVTAITSLYRPGPIDGGITPHYVARRHGKEPVTYPDPCLEGVLAHTYGCILFQEQCLQVTAVFAGMGLGESDNLRRGISKRIRPEVERIRDRFFAGAQRMGRDPKVTQEVWELLRNFAGYGFVKAHAACCASLAVREAYLKARWPIEYLSVVLSTGMGYYPPRVYVEDARSFGATLALPCVKRSEADYTVEGTDTLRVGLAHLKGLGPAGVAAILSARQDGPFANLADLKRRTGLARPELEPFIRIGGCEAFGLPRPGLMWQLGSLGRSNSPAPSPLQPTLFALTETAPVPPSGLGDYSNAQRQRIERELLGFTVTVDALPKAVGSIPFAEAKLLHQGAKVSVVAEIVSRFSHRTKHGEKMVFLTLTDGHEPMQAVVFPNAYRRLVMTLKKRRGVFSGTLGDEAGERILVVTSIEPLSHPQEAS